MMVADYLGLFGFVWIFKNKLIMSLEIKTYSFKM